MERLHPNGQKSTGCYIQAYSLTSVLFARPESTSGLKHMQEPST